MEQSVPKREATSYGPYQVVRKIGSGGMGTVFEARHEMLGLSVAIKTIGGNVSLTEETRARFLREARAAAKVRHQNVAQIRDIASQDGVPYMVLELLRGQTLAALLEREGRLPAARAADLLVPVIAGVAAAHDCAIVHRDLKPHNVFISEERAGPVPRVLDFGISKLVDDAASVLTRSDVLLGTAQYMSPEQARGSKHVDARSDQYSLGAVLYECVTGVRAFEADNIYGLVHRIVEGQFEPPSRVCAEVTPALEGVILRAMSLEPGDRYPTTASFGVALMAFASAKTRLVYADELGQSQPHSPGIVASSNDSATPNSIEIPSSTAAPHGTAANSGAAVAPNTADPIATAAATDASESAEAASGERLSASAVQARRDLALGSTVGEVTPLARARHAEARSNPSGTLVVLALVGVVVAYIAWFQNKSQTESVDAVPTGQPPSEPPVATADVVADVTTQGLTSVTATSSSLDPAALALGDVTTLDESAHPPLPKGSDSVRSAGPELGVAQRRAAQSASGVVPPKSAASAAAFVAESSQSSPTSQVSTPSQSSPTSQPKPNRATKHGLVQESPF